MPLDASPLELKIRELLGSKTYERGGPLHILVMLILVSYGSEMRPSGTTLAAEASLSRRQVSRVLRDLENWQFIVAVRREGRKPVVWEIGPALDGEPAKNHSEAIREKAKLLAAKDGEKPKPNPEKTKARTVRAVVKHLADTPFMAYDAAQRTTVVSLPDETVHESEQVLDDELPALQAPRVKAETFLSPGYASFAAAHTRDEEAA